MQFKDGDRAEFYRNVAGLSEMMAGFIRHLPSATRKEAISKAQNIHHFLIISGLKSTTIHNLACNYFGYDQACHLLNRPCLKGDSTVIEAQDLERIWATITDGFQSDHWLRLKMALYTRLPSTDRDPKIEKEADRQSAKNHQEFVADLEARDRELEAKLDDPAYWQEIQRAIRSASC